MNKDLVPAPPEAMMYTVEDIAEMCRVKRHTVREWARLGRLPGGFKLGKRWMWPAPVVARFLGLVPQTVAGEQPVD